MPAKGHGEWPLRWDLLLRYRLIEIIALWEGRLTTRHLCSAFGIGRQQASRDINTYLKDIAPGNLDYDTTLKGYKPAPGFIPQLTRGIAEEYLQLLSRDKDLAGTFEQLALESTHTEVLQLPLRNVQPEIIRQIVAAARQQQRLEVDYRSVNNPDPEGRVIVPHTLVFTGLRWHVRAWCEKNRRYTDFVLSRFRETPELLGPSPAGKDQDEDWNRQITLRIVPDPRLNPAQQAVVATDWGMQDHCLLIPTRAALVQYVLQAVHIDAHVIQAEPKAQQIVVANLDEIRPWLF